MQVFDAPHLVPERVFELHELRFVESVDGNIDRTQAPHFFRVHGEYFREQLIGRLIRGFFEGIYPGGCLADMDCRGVCRRRGDDLTGVRAYGPGREVRLHRFHPATDLAVHLGYGLADDDHFRVSLVAEHFCLVRGEVLDLVCSRHLDLLCGSLVVDEFEAFLREFVHDRVLNNADVRLLAVCAQPPGVDFLADILFRDHDKRPRLVHLSQQDADAREVVAQLSEGDLGIDADAQERAFRDLAGNGILFDIALGLREDLVADELIILHLGLRIDEDPDGLLHRPLLRVFERRVAGDIRLSVLDGRDTLGGDRFRLLRRRRKRGEENEYRQHAGKPCETYHGNTSWIYFRYRNYTRGRDSGQGFLPRHLGNIHIVKQA